MKNYLSEMLYALTSAYNRQDYDNRQRGSPLETNIGKLFSILAWGLDSVQEQTELIKLWEDLDNACGTVLDRYGANFGVKRISSDDRFYRLAIKIKLMSQLSGGDTNTVIRAASALLDVDLSEVLFEDVFPAKISLYVDKTLLSQECVELIEPIAYAIKRILAAGVGMRLYLRTYRTYRHDLTFLRCGHADTTVSMEPVSRDRMSIDEWGVKFGGVLETVFVPPPFSEDRISQMSVYSAHGAVQTPRVSATPLDAKTVHRGHTDGAGGAIYHTHIKSKRID